MARERSFGSEGTIAATSTGTPQRRVSSRAMGTATRGAAPRMSTGRGLVFSCGKRQLLSRVRLALLKRYQADL